MKRKIGILIISAVFLILGVTIFINSLIQLADAFRVINNNGPDYTPFWLYYCVSNLFLLTMGTVLLISKPFSRKLVLFLSPICWFIIFTDIFFQAARILHTYLFAPIFSLLGLITTIWYFTRPKVKEQFK
jgi:hypothetical protein